MGRLMGKYKQVTYKRQTGAAQTSSKNWGAGHPVGNQYLVRDLQANTTGTMISPILINLINPIAHPSQLTLFHVGPTE